MKCPRVSLEVSSKVRARTVRSGGFRPEDELYSVLLFFLSLTGPGCSHTLFRFISRFSEGVFFCDRRQLYCAS